MLGVVLGGGSFLTVVEVVPIGLLAVVAVVVVVVVVVVVTMTLQCSLVAWCDGFSFSLSLDFH